MALIRFLLIILVGSFIAACSGPPATTVTRPPIRDYETFDPSKYENVTPTTEEVEIEHDIPEPLALDDDEEKNERSGPMPGYRIQIDSDLKRDAVNSTIEDAINWWSAALPQGQEYERPRVYVNWEQPYWKVRIGDFKSRTQARAVVDMMLEDFKKAFIVPTTIQPK